MHQSQQVDPLRIAKSTELNRPNGLLATPKGLLVASFGANELYRLDDKGVRHQVTKLPEGSLDGLAQGPGGALFVSSWKSESVYKGKLGDKFEVAVSGIRAPADIGYDNERKRLLVPRFEDNAVEVYPLE